MKKRVAEHSAFYQNTSDILTSKWMYTNTTDKTDLFNDTKFRAHSNKLFGAFYKFLKSLEKPRNYISNNNNNINNNENQFKLNIYEKTFNDYVIEMTKTEENSAEIVLDNGKGLFI